MVVAQFENGARGKLFRQSKETSTVPSETIIVAVCIFSLIGWSRLTRGTAGCSAFRITDFSRPGLHGLHNRRGMNWARWVSGVQLARRPQRKGGKLRGWLFSFEDCSVGKNMSTKHGSFSTQTKPLPENGIDAHGEIGIPASRARANEFGRKKEGFVSAFAR